MRAWSAGGALLSGEAVFAGGGHAGKPSGAPRVPQLRHCRRSCTISKTCSIGAPVRAAASSPPRSRSNLRPDRAPHEREGLVRSYLRVLRSTLGLAPELLRAVAEQGYTEPTPVQREAIPLVLAGRDLLAGAQTGTGKTAAFVLPMLQRLAPRTPRDMTATGARRIRALILTPTRELALQVEESVRTYGASARPLDRHLRRRRLRPARCAPCATAREIVVATPGRLLDHVAPAHDRPRRGRDPGPRRGRPHARHGLHPRHPHDPRPAARRSDRTCSSARPSRRRSAAWPRACSTEPASVQVTPRNTRDRPGAPGRPSRSTARASASCCRTSSQARPHRPGAGLHPHQARRRPPRRAAAGRTASPRPRSTATSSQPQRIRALDDFKAGRVTLLVATEVAARGLDIEPLPARRQLRAADGRRRLRAPHRPHRPRRHRGRRHLAGVRRRDADCCATSSACWARPSRRRPCPASNRTPPFALSRFGCAPAAQTAVSAGAVPRIGADKPSPASSRGASVRDAPPRERQSATGALATAAGRDCPASASAPPEEGRSRHRLEAARLDDPLQELRACAPPAAR